MQMKRIALVCIAALAFPMISEAAPVAQIVPTATPAQVNLSQIVPAEAEPGIGPTATRTPTPMGQAILEARDFANVRAAPDTSAAQLGVIRSGERYNVTGRYYQWLQFQYNQSPTGLGWVFGDLVNITGDPATILQIDLNAEPTPDPFALGQTATFAILTQTPGGVLTATAAVRDPLAAFNTSENAGILPTFTYPPEIVPIAPTQPAASSIDDMVEVAQPAAANFDPSDLPPIVPIVVLGGMGLLGLAISAMRK